MVNGVCVTPPPPPPPTCEAGEELVNGVCVTPPPPPPVTDLAQVLGVGVAPGNAQLVVTWTAVDTATGYTVQWMSGSQAYNTGDRQAPVTSGSTTSHTIEGPRQRHGIHGAGDRDPDGRHRRPALGGDDGDAESAAATSTAAAATSHRRRRTLRR